MSTVVDGSLKTKLDSVSRILTERGWQCGLAEEWQRVIASSGLRTKNLALAFVAAEILHDEHPITLRGLFYRVVSAGWLPSTDKVNYTRLGRMMTLLRESEAVPFSWIVDNMRTTNKPSSWAGVEDFVETVSHAYRRDFWAERPDYVHIFCEKDAIAGVLAPVTREYDVALSPIRGYVSLSFAHEIAELWQKIEKPIYAYYMGDFDPSGFDLERDLRAKMERYCEDADVVWCRLAVRAEDFEEFKLIPLAPKERDCRYQTFVKKHGTQCAELDALPPTELRKRVRDAIEDHIDQRQWEKLKEVERLERESFREAMAGIVGPNGKVRRNRT